MTGIFEKAADSIAKFAPSQMSARKKALIEELLLIINTAPFMNSVEKQQLLRIVPLFSEGMIKSLKTSIVRQGVRFFNEYHATKS